MLHELERSLRNMLGYKMAKVNMADWSSLVGKHIELFGLGRITARCREKTTKLYSEKVSYSCAFNK